MIELATERKTTPITREAARSRRVDRSGLLERRGRDTPGDLPQDGEGALRCASTEARCASSPPDSDCLPASHGRGSAVCGAPLHDCGPATPLTEGARGGVAAGTLHDPASVRVAAGDHVT